MPFLFFEQNVILRNFKHNALSVEKEMRYLSKLISVVEAKIAKRLPDRFPVVMEGWRGWCALCGSIFIFTMDRSMRVRETVVGTCAHGWWGQFYSPGALQCPQIRPFGVWKNNRQHFGHCRWQRDHQQSIWEIFRCLYLRLNIGIPMKIHNCWIIFKFTLFTTMQVWIYRIMGSKGNFNGFQESWLCIGIWIGKWKYRRGLISWASTAIVSMWQ